MSTEEQRPVSDSSVESDEAQTLERSRREKATKWVTGKAHRANNVVQRVSWVPVGLAVGAVAALAVGAVVLKNRRG